ncbi:hypothetical protein [Ferruginibacter profundus]
MSNHFHLIWSHSFSFTPSDIQTSMMTHNTKQFKSLNAHEDAAALEAYKANKYDRDYQYREWESLSIELLPKAI